MCSLADHDSLGLCTKRDLRRPVELLFAKTCFYRRAGATIVAFLRSFPLSCRYMATAEVFPQARAQVFSLRWIISARDDLVWFIGSVASSYALLILYVAGVLPLIPMVALW